MSHRLSETLQNCGQECLEFGREVRVEMDVVAPGHGGVTEDTKRSGL